MTDGGATVKHNISSTPIVTATSTSTGDSFSGSAMVIKSTRTVDSAFNYLKAISDADNGGGTTVFSIVSDGKMRVHTGGLLVSLGGVTIDAGGMKVKDGVTINTNGLNVLTGGATVTADGLNVLDGGTTIIDTSVSSDVTTIPGVLHMPATLELWGYFM